MKRMGLEIAAAALAAAGMVGAGVGFRDGSWFTSAAHAANAGAATAAPAPPTTLALPDFRSIAAQYGPAVVNISVTQALQPAAALPQYPEADPTDPFFQFFRRFQTPAPSGGTPLRGQGSGFIVGADGLILTNAHVVDGAKEVDVKLTDKREFRAKVLGKDLQSDVAVLRIDARNLPTVRLGDPRSVRVGDWVVAIGSPFGFENSVTAGIVSAKGRTLPDESYVPFIQTDVAVNPGNSGGPLFNLSGEVIGINSQIFSGTGSYQGLSFAIPIDVALGVKDQLVAHGHVTRGYLGVSVQELSRPLAESFGLKSPDGALVSSVSPDGPAAKAGLEPGDVILKFADKPIAGSADLPLRVAAMTPGATAQLEVWRKGATKSIAVKVGELQPTQAAAADQPGAAQNRLGLTARPLTPDEQREAQVKGGLLVEEAAGPAASAGVQPGDVILAMNGTPVRSVAQLRGLLAGSGKHVALLVQRDGTQLFVPVTLG
jgi:serine protease Do